MRKSTCPSWYLHVPSQTHMNYTAHIYECKTKKMIKNDGVERTQHDPRPSRSHPMFYAPSPVQHERQVHVSQSVSQLVIKQIAWLLASFQDTLRGSGALCTQPTEPIFALICSDSGRHRYYTSLRSHATCGEMSTVTQTKMHEKLTTKMEMQ